MAREDGMTVLLVDPVPALALAFSHRACVIESGGIVAASPLHATRSGAALERACPGEI